MGVEKDDGAEDQAQMDILRKHILDIWCNGEEAVCSYLLNWMAHLVQFPGVKMISCPVLKGGQGAGKGIIIQKLGAILGQTHFIAVTDANAVLGQYQQEKTLTNLLTFLDECTFSGDKKQASALKGLLSEDTRYWTAKYVNGYTIRNCSNFIIASNYDAIVFKEIDDRRFLCLELDNRFAGPATAETRKYFNRLAAVPNAAFAHFLYNRDVSKFDPTIMPSSKYQIYQKMLNFDSAHGWLYASLTAGTLFVDKDVAMNEAQELQRKADCEALFLESDKSVLMEKDLLYKHYSRFANHSSQKFKGACLPSSGLFKVMKNIFRDAMVDKGKRGVRGQQKAVVLFKTLGECRKLFANAICEPTYDWGGRGHE